MTPAEQVHNVLTAKLATGKVFLYSLPAWKGDREWILDTPLPAPLGMNCPDHPNFPLVVQDRQAFCRFGRHSWS